MHILQKYKVRQVSGENIVLIQGSHPGDMTRVIALNDTSLYLWNNLYDRDFSIEDIVSLLMEKYDVNDTTARADASEWVKTLKEHNIVV